MRSGDALQAELDAEIATRHHHAVGDGENVIEVPIAERRLDLGDDRRLPDVGPDRPDVVRRGDEGCRHEVEAELLPEAEVLFVLGGDDRCRR